jgi:hypothetical protein
MDPRASRTSPAAVAHGAPIRRRVARVLRAAAVWLLVIVASGTVSVAATCIHDVSGCQETCARCSCKRRPLGDTLRAPCSCCQPQPGARPIAFLETAVLPDNTSSLRPPSHTEAMGASSASVLPYFPSVPHPPPRTSALF